MIGTRPWAVPFLMVYLGTPGPSGRQRRDGIVEPRWPYYRVDVPGYPAWASATWCSGVVRFARAPDARRD